MVKTCILQETVISECEEEKGNFLCGPEWRVRITTKSDQLLDVKQVLSAISMHINLYPRNPRGIQLFNMYIFSLILATLVP